MDIADASQDPHKATCRKGEEVHQEQAEHSKIAVGVVRGGWPTSVDGIPTPRDGTLARFHKAVNHRDDDDGCVEEND